MDDERRIGEALERIASDVPPAGRPPQRFRTKARRRMARTSLVAAVTSAAVVAGGLTGLRALQGSSTPGGSITPSPPGPAPSSAPPSSSPAFVQHIAFQSDRSGNDDIWIMDADGTNLRDLTNDPAGDTMPGWSPDGARIAFSSDRSGAGDIFVMDADGSNIVDLSDSENPETAPTWSPDGSVIAYERLRPGGAQEIWLMRADGSDKRRLTDGVYGFRMSWSPDGSEIAFSGSPGAPGISAIRADGTGLRSVTTGNTDADPSWCPDGRHPIAFTRSAKEPDIWLIAPHDGQAGRLTHDGASAEPDWSPSGASIAFARLAAPGDSDLFVVGLARSTPQQLTSGPADDQWPAWQP
jgi:TolB protein